MENVPPNFFFKNSQKILFYEIKEKACRYNIKFIIKKRIFIILFILFIKFQVIISDNPVITLKIRKKGKNSIIYNDFKMYLSEIYINDENMSNIETSYNFSLEDNTVKIILNSQINNCSKMFMNCRNITEINFTNFES